MPRSKRRGRRPVGLVLAAASWERRPSGWPDGDSPPCWASTSDVGGGLEGVAIGGAAGAGYAIATRTPEAGMVAPRGSRRLRSALITAVRCGLAGLALTLAGRPLVAGTIHAIADAPLTGISHNAPRPVRTRG